MTTQTKVISVAVLFLVIIGLGYAIWQVTRLLIISILLLALAGVGAYFIITRA